MGTNGTRKLIAALALVCAVLSTARAQAHMGSSKALLLTRTEHGATVQASLELADVGLALGLGLSPDVQALRAQRGLLMRWLASGVSVSDGSGVCRPTTHAPRLVSRGERRMVEVEIDYLCAQPGSALSVTDSTVFEQDAGHKTYVTLRAGQREESLVLTATQRTATLAAEPSGVATLLAFVRDGASHLFGGYDHLAFLLALLLVAGARSRERGYRATLREVAWVVSAFTVGHSVTLVAASLGFIPFSATLVEVAIAASIVVVAALNLTARFDHARRPALALAFGLLHGLGFSSVLDEVGLPQAQRAVALFGFNVGIELAQLAFVVIALVPLMLLARRSFYQRWVLRMGSAAIALVACFWAVERAVQWSS